MLTLRVSFVRLLPLAMTSPSLTMMHLSHARAGSRPVFMLVFLAINRYLYWFDQSDTRWVLHPVRALLSPVCCNVPQQLVSQCI